MIELSESEIAFIREARAFLENPRFLIRAANLLGRPLDRGLTMLPVRVQTKIQTSVKISIEKGLAVVTKTVKPTAISFSEAETVSQRKGFFHSAATFGTGAFGGFFGVASLPIELPITTAIMLRSIVSTAQDFGMDLSKKETQLECLYVLSLGSAADPVTGAARSEETLQSAYWTSRLAFTDLIRHAARELGKGTTPFLVRFLAQVASRFQLVVSEKALAELVPIIGAVGGGIINAAFTEHFNSAARYHFGLRALERKFGEDQVRDVYLRS